MGLNMRETVPVFPRTDRLLHRSSFGCVDHRISSRLYRQTSGPSDMSLRARHDGGGTLHGTGEKNSNHNTDYR